MYREKLKGFSPGDTSICDNLTINGFTWRFEMKMKRVENIWRVGSYVRLTKCISLLPNVESIKTIRFLSQKEGSNDIDVDFKEIGLNKAGSEIKTVDLDEDDFVTNGLIYVKCIVSTNGLPGPQLSSIDFFRPSNRSDVILVVEGKRLHVNKMQLALCSKVFDKMFFSDFREATRKEIKLEDIKWFQFYILLQQIYSIPDTINEKNWRYLLELADLFNIPRVVHDCERFLLQHQIGISVAEKIEYADKYDMIMYLGVVVANMEKFDIRRIKESKLFDKLKANSRDLLFNRALDIN